MTNNRQIKKLWEIVDILDNQRSPISSKEREKRNQWKSKEQLYPYYWATRQNGWIDDYIFDEELVLLGEDWADFHDKEKEPAYIINWKSWVNNHAHVLRGKKWILDNKFLCFFLNIFDYHWYVAWTTRMKLNQWAMREIPIPLPPLSTQQLIVAKLDETFAQIDEAITTTQANIAQTDELTKSVLDKVFEEGEWEKIKLWSLCEIITWNTPPTQFKDYYWWKILWAWPSDFWDFKIVNSTNKTITEKWLKEWKARIIKKWSVMLVAIWATIWKVWIAWEDMTTNQQINTFETWSELHNEFLYYYFRKIRNFFLGMSSQTTLPILNKSQCKDIEIPLPPLAKQQEIVSYLDNVFAQSSQLKEQYQKKLVELKELKASVLQSAFEGKLV